MNQQRFLECRSRLMDQLELSRDMPDDEILALIDELMTLEDPYHCPHGRPTILEFTRKDLEKKFKRIV